MRPPTTQIDTVYQRLLAQEPDAPNDFIELLLNPLIEALVYRFPDSSLTEMVSDVVIDALLKFVQMPERYQPEKGNLWNYLLLDVQGDMLNALAKRERRQNKEILFDPVAHDLPDGNINIEEEVMQRLEGSSLLEEVPAQNILERFQSEITDPRDWQFLLLMFDGERHTSAFANILEINHLPMNEQRVLVKRTKDRLRQRLKRYGVKNQ
jgi:RNA polymerase sigma-70 factor (ECF subfamily)